ncbi:MAG: LacI family DNA-binding transcriptional regulator [Nibricoccus sp.]
MPVISNAPSKGRVTLRMIASACKVSVMTVSYALRNNTEVSVEERLRIQRIADELGYRPDPLLTHLMQHLRSQRTLKFAGNLAVLTNLRAPFVTRLLTGAHARAERLGYHLDEINVREHVQLDRVLTRTLTARGISGVLLAPAEKPTTYLKLLDWSKFAAVAMTYSIVEPHVHRVVTHHFDNAVRTFAILEQRGFRRIGLAMTRDMEFRTNHSYTGAYHRMIETGTGVRIPILYLNETSERGMRQWFLKYRPEAVVVANAYQVKSLLRPAIGAKAAGRTAFLCLDYEEAAGVGGVDQLFETIGSSAVDSLVAQIHRNEKGLPANPTIAMVEGRWVDEPE